MRHQWGAEITMAEPGVDVTELDHPMRRELHDELHARPSVYFEGDSDVWHMAILGTRIPDSILALPTSSRSLDGKHGIAELGDCRLKWELHTEFLTITYVCAASQDRRPPQTFMDLRRQISGETIAAIRVLVRENRPEDELEKLDGDYVASRVGGTDAEVYSNFKLDDAGFVELLLFPGSLNAFRTGRMVRRLLEIETYRMMALLALPVARDVQERLAGFDTRLNRIVDHMQTHSRVDKTLLGEMTRLSSEVLRLSSPARHRFGAAKAYAELVSSRMAELREQSVPQRQRLGTFIERRFRPAIRTVEAVERRLDELGERVSLAGDLLRTSVQVQLEEQNAILLASMEERTRAQVHIQQAVEGFSVIAITYYAISLAKTCIEALTGLGLDTHLAKELLLFAIPIVLVTVWQVIRHIRKSISVGSHSGKPDSLPRPGSETAAKD